MKVESNLPVYPMGVAAKLLNVHPRTLRIYEEEGLVCPERKGGKRMYSADDLAWISCIRSLIHDENLSIPGIKKLLELMPCWKLKGCSRETRKNCSACGNQHKRCWEFAQKSCEKSCCACDTFLKDSKNKISDN